MSHRNKVLLVDENDEILGVEDKLSAHQGHGKRHRAFSVFITNADGHLLMQKRASAKYHAGGLWSNSCCSHPQPGEDIVSSAESRLQEELGFTTSVQKFSKIEYREYVGNNLTEWELDHLFWGESSARKVIPNPDEVDDIDWVDIDELQREISLRPDAYTSWLPLILPEFCDFIKKNKSAG
ncbi:MAG: isopentenyl-diphosphate Delta-isomerase [Porticoccaceae bacterium]